MNYKDTLLMPKTDFEMRGNLPKKEPKYVERWQENDMITKLSNKTKEKTALSSMMVLHMLMEICTWGIC